MAKSKLHQLLKEQVQLSNGVLVIDQSAVRSYTKKIHEAIPKRIINKYAKSIKESGDYSSGIAPTHWYHIFTCLDQLRKLQGNEVNDIYTRKIALALQDTQLQDAFSEIFVATLYGLKFPIVPDVLTAVVGKSGKQKDADLLVNSDFFVEVKNYSITKTRDYKLLEWAQENLFETNAQNMNSGSFELIKQRGSSVYVKKFDNPNIKSIGMANYNQLEGSRLIGLLKNAENKFRKNDRAVVVITNVINTQDAGNAIDNYLKNKRKEEYPIKSIVITTPISPQGKFDSTIYKVTDDQAIDAALKDVYNL